MLGFLREVDALRNKAVDLYQAIEEEYRHGIIDGESLVVYSPMNIPAGNIGMSTKDYHNNAYYLGRAACRLLSSSGVNEKLVGQVFTEIERFQSNLAKDEDDKGFRIIPDKLNATRMELVQLSRELIVDIARFKGNRQLFISNEGLKGLFNHFADKFVSKHKFNDIQYVFNNAEKNVLKQTDFDIECKQNEPDNWLKMVFVSDFGVDGLLGQLTSNQLAVLKEIVVSKYPALPAQKETTGPAITHAFTATTAVATNVDVADQDNTVGSKRSVSTRETVSNKRART